MTYEIINLTHCQHRPTAPVHHQHVYTPASTFHQPSHAQKPRGRPTSSSAPFGIALDPAGSVLHQNQVLAGRPDLPRLADLDRRGQRAMFADGAPLIGGALP